ncbi:MAG: hypothetical protein FJY80_09560 [Candidatus Aminicenantes bacterium]|nr:hypothetical protein [Candidatus Aminicenantes bacterium]
MTLRREQEELFRKTLDEMRRQIGDIDGRIEEEIAALKGRLADLQATKKTMVAAYRGLAKLLGEDEGPEVEEARAVPPGFKAN